MIKYLSYSRLLLLFFFRRDFKNFRIGFVKTKIALGKDTQAKDIIQVYGNRGGRAELNLKSTPLKQMAGFLSTEIS